MSEILNFVISSFSSIFESMKHFSLSSSGFPSFFDLCIALIFFRVVLYLIHFIQDVDEVESVSDSPTSQYHHIRRR